MEKKAEINLQPSHVKAYRYIQKYVKKNIVAPEIAEIASGIKLTVRHTYRIIDDLQDLGYISKDSHKKRSIKIEKPMR